MSASPRVSVVINTFNRLPWLKQAIDGLRHQSFDNFEVVVVNGPSTDGTAEYVQALPDVKYGETDVLNLSVSRNVGIAMTDGDYVAFLDDDAVPEPCWLRELLLAFEGKTELAAVGGYIRDLGGAFASRWMSCDRFGTVDVDAPADLPQYPFCFRFYFAPGGNVMYDRRKLLQVDGFDEQFSYGYDETELCARLVDAGYTIGYAPRAEVVHALAPSPLRDHRGILLDRLKFLRSKAYFIWRYAPVCGDAACEQAVRDAVADCRREARLFLRESRITEAEGRRIVETAEEGAQLGTEDFRRTGPRLLTGPLMDEWARPFVPFATVQASARPGGTSPLRVFVASWFFPPNSSSEGFVTYKLLRNSAYEYDVVCSTSRQWGYAQTMQAADDNIRILPVETNDPKVWAAKAVEMFEKLQVSRSYDAVMTRTMPPEAAAVGREIKRRHPEIPWVASFSDPIANNPEWMRSVERSETLPRQDVEDFRTDMLLTRNRWRQDWRRHSDVAIRFNAEQRALQDTVLDEADLVICPVLEQREYMLAGRIQKKPFCIVPHSYDERLYSETWPAGLSPFSPDKVNLVYLGCSDVRRSLLPVVRALCELYGRDPQLASRVCLHVFGTYPAELSDRVKSCQMPRGLVALHGSCTYGQSLSVMRHADWLLHVDAYFPSMSATGGSVFFAGKLADYFGAGKPVLAVTGPDTPASRMVREYGGFVCSAQDLQSLQDALVRIARDEDVPSVRQEVRQSLSAPVVTAEFDRLLAELVRKSV